MFFDKLPHLPVNIKQEKMIYLIKTAQPDGI